MFNKLYVKIKSFIKENYKQFLILILLLLVINYPLNYSIMASGGTIDISDRIEIDNKSNTKGSFSMAYVTELKGTIPSVLLSYVIPDWKRVPLEEYQVDGSETSKDIMNRAKIYLEYSKQAAIKVAYDKASRKFDIKDNKFFVAYKSELAEGDIKTGDVLLQIDGKKLNELYEYKSIVDSKNIGDTITLTVEREGKKLDLDIKVKQIDGEKLTGVSILNLFDYKTDPKINLSFKDNESGSSGGLMLSLAIYNELIDYDLTNGLKIVGTGTIDFYGNVGEIDGVKYKLKGAVKSGADVFIAPVGKNYDECIKLKKEKGYDIKIIGVKTFDEAVEGLIRLKP